MWASLPSALSDVGSVVVLFLAAVVGLAVVIFVVRWILAALVSK